MNEAHSQVAVVVNDDAVQLQVLTVRLQSLGLRVHACREAEEALALMSGPVAPHLIVTDLYMPRIDGWRLCHLARSAEYPALNRTPILVVSATYSGAAVRDLCLEAGADAFLAVPCSNEDFAGHVQALLSGNRWRRPLRALLVDDSPMIILCLQKAFEHHGYEVLAAATGAEARRLFSEQHPDVVLLDYHLPDQPGDQLLEEFNRECPQAPVLIMTFDPTPELATQVLQRGAAAYFRKPFDPAYVLGLCDNARRQRALLLVESVLELRTQELRDGERRYRTLFTEVPSAFALGEWVRKPEGDVPEGRFLEANPAFEAMIGLARAAIVGKTVGEVMGADGPRWLEALRQAARGPAPTPFELHSRERDRWFEGVAVSPQPDQFTVAFNDITERKRAEASLRESEERYRALVEFCPDAIFVHTDGRIVYANPAAARLLGATDQRQIVGRTVLEFVHPDFRELVLGRITTLLEGRGSVPLVQEKLLRLDGRDVDVEVAATPFTHDGRPAVQVIVRDTTERRQLEARLLRAQRMESIGTLASGMAHDLNNVLAPILMGAGLLRDWVSDPDAQSTLALIEQSAKRGRDVIQQLLTFARGIPGQRVAVQAGDLLRQISRMAEETFPKTIAVAVQVPEGLWRVRGDLTQLHQVLLNLCLNARDAMPNGGELSLGAENVTLDESYVQMNPEAKPGQYVLFTVTDTGVGMPHHVQERIFDPFFTTKEHGKGTGLGLSTALGIIKGHHGFLHVRSEPGKGAEFKLYLPATEVPAETAAPEAALAPARGAGELVLVVEDEPAVRLVVERALQQHGYRVLTANDGTEAVALYARHAEQVRIVLTDIVMPNMDGIATIRVLRRMSPEVRVIAMSGNLNHQQEATRVAGGIQAFLSKPFTAEQLLSTIQRVKA